MGSEGQAHKALLTELELGKQGTFGPPCPEGTHPKMTCSLPLHAVSRSTLHHVQ